MYSYRSTEANALYLTTRLYDAGVLEDVFRQKAGQEELLRSVAGDEEISCPPEPNGEKLAVLLQQSLYDTRLREEILRLYGQKLQEDPGLLEKLAEAEHRRWNAYMICNGWIRMPLESLHKELKRGGNHKDYQTLQHACIAPWEVLPAVSLAVTGGTDADKYQNADREMVLHLPIFLR